jgi:Mce-associated membrane protein
MRRALTVGLVVLVAALGALAVQAGRSRNEAQAAADDRQGAMRMAAAHAVTLLSVNHRTIDDDIKRALATSTGPERERYAGSQGALRAATLKNKVVQTGVIRATALTSMGADRRTAQALVVADAVIRWEDGRKAAPEERFFRWRMDLAKVSGLWLVARAEIVQ